MLQIAYFSTAATEQSADELRDILSVARGRNARDGISGLLVAGGNRYMQVIEGPALEVDDLWQSIRGDQRHCAITQLLKRSVAEPAFKDWSMAYSRADRLGEFHSFPQTLKYLTRQIEDDQLRRQIEYFARSFIAPAPGHEASAWAA
jgi:hypothetical protein